MSLTLPTFPGTGAALGDPIDFSGLFNKADDACLTRTPAAEGNRTRWTWSGWVKRASPCAGSGEYQVLFEATTGSHQTLIGFDRDSDTLRFAEYQANNVGLLVSQGVLVDLAGWYHVVCGWDSDNTDPDLRMRLWINGGEVTSYSTYTVPSQGRLSTANRAVQHNIGRQGYGGGNSHHLDGYLAEVVFVDGQALDAAAFGEVFGDLWRHKAFVGDVGSNGFRLDFANASNLGGDASGNGNNWAPANLTSSDQRTDTPTNNYATLSPDLGGANNTYSEGNTVVWLAGGNGGNQAVSEMPVSSGKWVFATKSLGPHYLSWRYIGFGKTGSLDGYPGQRLESWGYNASGQWKKNAANLSTGHATWTASGDGAAIALDLDNGKAWVGLFDGTAITWEGDPAAGTGAVQTGLSGPLFPMVGWYGTAGYGGVEQLAEFALDGVTLPDGFLPLTSQNAGASPLAEVT
ncbi:hypothetical protein [Roseospirillum parvum]|uniref:Concanavalin A-like lectin/glucanases superfamily protein n=1 Tax=Roseospirillum parvum TaxID=83401 RepID=A0A1G7U7T4_9PROT|nr:hypothetical protein [Roseospirillum parvum]SDG43109.1 hypothetical protein SAMN05421742_101226 [Roseospirillum parvum]